jgi:hypothetical protein
LSKQSRNFHIDCLFSGKAGFFVPAFDKVFDLVLNDFLFCLRLPAFAYLVFIVHKFILLQPELADFTTRHGSAIER